MAVGRLTLLIRSVGPFPDRLSVTHSKSQWMERTLPVCCCSMGPEMKKPK